MRIKRLFYLLILNIIISTLVTLLVLNFWPKPESRMAATVVVTVMVTVPVPQPGSANLTAPTNTPGLTPETVTIQGSETPVPLQPYIVQEGDMLSKIALQFNVSMDDILRANGMSDPNNIYIGQKLLIPLSSLPTETPQLPPTDIPTITPIPSITPTPTATPTTDMSPARLVIESIQGAGILGSEKVKIVHTGGGAEPLGGWQLENGRGQAFVFPLLRLFPGASVIIHSGKGTNTVTDLFWGSDGTFWKSGDTATLRDSAGKVRATFTVP